MAIKHTFSSPKADGADATLVRPSDWNASHDDGGLQANVDAVSVVAVNATSIANAASNAASIVSQAVSVETVNRVSADDVLSNAISVVSLFVDQVHLADADATSQPWETLVAGTNITFTEVADGHALQIDATAGSGSVTSTELSATSAQAASAINVVSNALSVLSQATSVADAALSVRIDVVSAAVVSGTDTGLVEADSTSQPWETLIAGSNVTLTELADGHALQIDIPAIDTVSNAISVVSQALSVLSQATSVADAALSVRVDAVSQAHSVLSQAVSVADAALSVRVDTVSQAHSVLSQSVSVLSNAASNALSVANAASNAASIVSQALSVEIVNRVSADNALSALIDTVSNAASNATSIANTASNAASIVSQAVSVVSAYLDQVALEDASGTSQPWDTLVAGTNITFTELADGHALQIDATPGSASVTSTELSAVSAQAASAIVVVSNAVSNLTSAHNVLSNLVSNALSAGDTLSTELSALNATGVDGSQTGQPWDWLVAGTNVTFTELADGHALLVDATAGSGSVTSTELSAVSAQAASAINVVSNAVSALEVRVSTLSAAPGGGSVTSVELENAILAEGDGTTQPWETIIAGSNIVFTELADGHAIQIDIPAIDTVSNAVSVVSQALSVLSQAVSVADAALSVRIDTVSNVASNAISIANAASNAASIVSQTLSVETINRVSADNALSALIDTVSNVASNATSIANAASNAASVVSQAVSVVSAYLDQVALEDAGGTSQPWDTLIAGTGIAFTELADGHAIQFDASVTSNELSIVSAQAASAISQTNSALVVLINATSNQASIIVAAVSGRVDTVSNVASNAISIANAASNAASILSQAVSVADAALSVRIDTVSNVASNATSIANAASNAASIVSQAVSVVSLYLDAVALEDAGQAAQPWDFLLAGTNVTFTEVADGHGLLVDATAGSGSVTSTELSAVSAQAASAINVVSNAVSALEVRVSALSAAGPGGGSVTSAELEQATLIDADATQQPWETIIAGDNVTFTELGDGGGHAMKMDVTGPTTRVVANDQGISVTGQTNISGMSVSVVAAGIYRLDAMMLVNRGAGAAVAKMGLTFPAMKTARGYIKYTLSSPNGIPATTTEVVSSQGFFCPFDGDSASGSIIVSAANTAGIIVSNLAVYQGLFIVSTAGTIQLQAGASTSAGTGLTILAGSYMQVFRIA